MESHPTTRRGRSAAEPRCLNHAAAVAADETVADDRSNSTIAAAKAAANWGGNLVRCHPANRAVRDVAAVVVAVAARAPLAQPAGVTVADVALAHPARASTPERARNMVRELGKTVVSTGAEATSDDWSSNLVRRDPVRVAVADVAVAPIPPGRASALGTVPAGVSSLDVAHAHPARRSAPQGGRDVVREPGVGGVWRDPAVLAMRDVAMVVMAGRTSTHASHPAGVTAGNVASTHPARRAAPD